MNKKNNQMSVGLMIQRCHKWRQKRKQYMDQARQIADTIERERMMQMAEHYGRIVSYEQGKIDNNRDTKDKTPVVEEVVADVTEEDEAGFPDFITNLK
ncbi:hypothetical protein LJC18_02015 [Lachnospiraceae bacterium OttesenSCG-928-E19]|nr:hypothetical protein [Lachnospiraceae bacterium OttesenSCG-928-E19]